MCTQKFLKKINAEINKEGNKRDNELTYKEIRQYKKHYILLFFQQHFRFIYS